MKKLADLDDFYKNFVLKFTLIDKFDYCNSRKNFIKDMLQKHNDTLDEQQKIYLQNFVDSFNAELQDLRSQLMSLP